MKRILPFCALLIVLSGCSIPGHGRKDDDYTITGYVAVTGPSSITFSGGTPTGERTIDGKGEFIDNGCTAPLLNLTTRPELYGFENTLLSTGRITKTGHARYDDGGLSQGCLFYYEFDHVAMSRSFTVKLNAFMEQRDIPRDKLNCDESKKQCTLDLSNIQLP